MNTSKVVAKIINIFMPMFLSLSHVLVLQSEIDEDVPVFEDATSPSPLSARQQASSKLSNGWDVRNLVT